MALQVNGELVDEAVLREERNLIRERLRQELPDESESDIDTQVREWALDNVIERVLLRQAAQGFTEAQTPPPEIDHESYDDWRVAAFLDHLTKNIPPPTRREVSSYYRKNQLLFLSPECVHASQIVKHVDDRVSEADARAAIETAEAELHSGRPFAEVADERSDSPGAGGDLGWLPRGHLPAEFDALVFALKPSQVSPILRSPLGFHLVQLHARKAAGVLPLREVYNLAEELLLKRRRDEAVERFLNDVLAKSDIRRVAADTRT